MVQVVNSNSFKGISPKDLMEATYQASGNFQIRAFFEAKDEILKAGKFSEEEFYRILDAMMDAETERKLVLEKLKDKDPLFLEEIVKEIKDFPADNIIRDVIYLKEQGYVQEHVEVKTKWLLKKLRERKKK